MSDDTTTLPTPAVKPPCLVVDKVAALASIADLAVISAPHPGGVVSVPESALLALKSLARIEPRGPAETNPELKQLIPYAMLEYDDKVLIYRRGKPGAEPRLHDKLSVGVGGHIEEVDWAADASAVTAFETALRRELREEVGLTADHIEHATFIGLVNEDHTEVGQVHLGLIYLVQLTHIDDLRFEDALASPCWMTHAELEASMDEMELWSQLVIAGPVR